MADADIGRERRCEQCGTGFTATVATRRFCTDACQRRNHSAKRISRTATCEGCGVTFNPKRTDRARYCTRACSFAHGEAARRAVATRMERYPPAPKPDTTEADALRRIGRGIPASLGRLLLIQAKRQRAAKPCLTCGKPIGASRSGSGGASYCTTRCAQQSASFREAKRAARLARKAKERSARVETVSPLRVFERDGWRCHLCGGLTIKGKRGSYHAKAPELDHIVPLSKGGDHSYANTACAHRSCNIAKSDRVIGQPSLLAA